MGVIALGVVGGAFCAKFLLPLWLSRRFYFGLDGESQEKGGEVTVEEKEIKQDGTRCAERNDTSGLKIFDYAIILMTVLVALISMITIWCNVKIL